jgi:hypothetical protein
VEKMNYVDVLQIQHFMFFLTIFMVTINTEIAIFLAKCKENGKTIVLKRLWEHIAHEQSEVIF